MLYNTLMQIRYYEDRHGQAPLTTWIEALPDKRAKTIIRARLARVAGGNLGELKPVREGVQELVINYGPGYRVYLSRQGPVLVLLLCGSDKKNQNREIEKAIEYLNDWKQRGKP